jgi:hypothetical protein
MDDVIEDFETRVLELDAYLKVLDRLEKPDVALMNRSTQREVRVFGDDSFKVMKATVFLLLYNIVEATVPSAFREVYRHLESEGKAFADVREELRKLWVGQGFRILDFDSAARRNYRELTEDMTEAVINGTILSLSEDELPISGNLNAKEIRRVCHLHGIDVATHFRARGGVELETVKLHRNHLGHGNVTFSDCGRQFTVSDLERIKRECVVFVRSVLKNIKKYVENAEYAA